MRFGGAPDAPDTLFVRPPKACKNHAVPLRRRLWSCPMRAFPMPSRAPLTRNGGPMMGVGGTNATPESKL